MRLSVITIDLTVRSISKPSLLIVADLLLNVCENKPAVVSKNKPNMITLFMPEDLNPYFD